MPEATQLTPAKYPVGHARAGQSFQRISGPDGTDQVDVPPKARYALISVETQAVRFRDDGTAPTTSLGMPIAATEKLEFNGDLSALQIIEQTATAVVTLLFYK